MVTMPAGYDSFRAQDRPTDSSGANIAGTGRPVRRGGRVGEHCEETIQRNEETSSHAKGWQVPVPDGSVGRVPRYSEELGCLFDGQSLSVHVYSPNQLGHRSNGCRPSATARASAVSHRTRSRAKARCKRRRFSPVRRERAFSPAPPLRSASTRRRTGSVGNQPFGFGGWCLDEHRTEQLPPPHGVVSNGRPLQTRRDSRLERACRGPPASPARAQACSR
jgi:hypothetical protein